MHAAPAPLGWAVKCHADAGAFFGCEAVRDAERGDEGVPCSRVGALARAVTLFSFAVF